MFAWFTGLGIAAKVVLGATVAAAAGATGVGAVAGVNILVSANVEHEQEQQVTPGGDPTEAPADEPGTFGDSVSDRAHELGADGSSTGAEFGAEISGEAQLQGEGNAQNPDGPGVNGSGSANVEGDVEIAPELPDVVPGGDD